MNSIKKMLITALILCVMGFVLAGCSNKQVIVATINGEAVSEQLYRINLWSTQRGLESINENYWSLDNIYGQSPEEYAKSKALRAVTYCIVVEQKAKEFDIKLTKDEKAKVKEAAKKAMRDEESFAKANGITQKDYETYYTFAAQNEKVLERLADSYEPNEEEVQSKIEDIKTSHQTLDEANIVQILFSTRNELGESIPEDKKQEVYEKAQKVLAEALNGEDMKSLAEKYSDDQSVESNAGEYTFTRGSLDSALEDVVFEKAEVGTVYPEIIETEMGYEIVKVLSINYESDDAIRERALESIRESIQVEYASQELDEMTNFADVQKTEAYDAISVGPLEASELDKEDETSPSAETTK